MGVVIGLGVGVGLMLCWSAFSSARGAARTLYQEPGRPPPRPSRDQPGVAHGLRGASDEPRRR